MINALPIDISIGIRQIIDKINANGDSLSYPELNYYNMRLVREVNKLYNSMFTFGMPVEFTKVIQDKIDYIESAMTILEKLMSNKSLNNYGKEVEKRNFSTLTNRLNNLML